MSERLRVSHDVCNQGWVRTAPRKTHHRHRQHAAHLETVWQRLVGSQALLGIPRALALRTDPVLAAVSRVWPFKTGLQTLPDRSVRDWLVLHAEIYPSLLSVDPAPGEVKDAAQVRSLVSYFADLDNAGPALQLICRLR